MALSLIVVCTVGSSVIQQHRDLRCLSPVSTKLTLHETRSLNAHDGPSAPRPISSFLGPSNELIGPSPVSSPQEVPES